MAKKRPTTKADKVTKVAQETKVDTASLERLNIEALDKLDELTPDEEVDELLGDSPSEEVEPEALDKLDELTPDEEVEPETLESSPIVEGIVSEESLELDEPKSSDNSERVRVLAGYHPITEEPIYI